MVIYGSLLLLPPLNNGARGRREKRQISEADKETGAAFDKNVYVCRGTIRRRGRVLARISLCVIARYMGGGVCAWFCARADLWRESVRGSGD